MNDHPSSLPFITATNGKLEKEKKEDQRNCGMEWSYKEDNTANSQRDQLEP